MSNINRSDIRQRPTRISLPNVKNINTKQIDLTNSNVIVLVEELNDEFETNKRVQFSRNVTIVSETDESRKMNRTKRHSFPIIDILSTANQQTNFLPTQRLNNPTETILYRSPINRTLSFSTSPSVTSSHRWSLSSNLINLRQRNTSSIKSSSINTSSTTNKARFSSLEFNSSLSEIDRKNLNDIHQIIPDEFEKLVPILIKLGLIYFPKKFFQNNYQEEEMTTQELIERHRLFSLIKKDQENIQYKYYLQRLYGNDNIHYEQQLLRETLSFQGQLALIETYQDQIERELNNKIKFWKKIPMISITNNYSEYSYSTNRSAFGQNSFRIRKKSIQSNSSIKSNIDLQSTIDQNSFQILIPDHIDKQWKRKSIVIIIEQGIILLDKVRSLSTSNQQFIQDNIYDINQLNIVKEFKRWVFLWSTLYQQDMNKQ